MALKLKILRQRKGLSQFTVSQKTGIVQSNLSDFELNKRKPWPKVIKKLERFYRLPISELLTEEPEAGGEENA